MLAFSKTPIGVGIFLLSPENRKRSSFLKVMFYSYVRVPDDEQSPEIQPFQIIIIVVLVRIFGSNIGPVFPEFGWRE
jgi:hypothetical protein